MLHFHFRLPRRMGFYPVCPEVWLPHLCVTQRHWKRYAYTNVHVDIGGWLYRHYQWLSSLIYLLIVERYAGWWSVSSRLPIDSQFYDTRSRWRGISQLLGYYRSIIGWVLVDHWPTTGRQSADCGPTTNRLSITKRLTIDRHRDRLSNKTSDCGQVGWENIFLPWSPINEATM